MADAVLAAPELIDLEVTAVLRRQVLAGRLDQHRAELALEDLSRLQIQRAAHLPLLARIWTLRDNLSAYDAAYVALAEALDVELLTADARLASAPGLRCRITVLG
jgi:predicted nucleic acid-binding protein